MFIQGASLGSDVDKLFAEAGILGKRLPFQADATMRKGINNGDFLFVDQHLSHTAELLRADVMDIYVAILEAVAITEDGMIIPTTSIGNSLAFSLHAKSIIIEMNMAQSTQLEDCMIYMNQVNRGKTSIPLVKRMIELEQLVSR